MLRLVLPWLVTASSVVRGPRFDRVYPLKPAEGVFAYARVSPDGRTLAYASEMRAQGRSGITQTVTVVGIPGANGQLVDRRLGAQTAEELREWVTRGSGCQGVLYGCGAGGEIPPPFVAPLLGGRDDRSTA